MYRTLTGTVVPHPIGWIVTTGPEGVDNLAPYSFFNVVSVAGVLIFAPGIRADGLTDTARNVRETEGFVVNVVTRPFAEAMNETSASIPSAASPETATTPSRAASGCLAPADRTGRSRSADAAVFAVAKRILKRQ